MFNIAQDQHYLLVMNWTENIDSTSFNSYHCYQFYSEIHINGVQNGYSLFNDYSILSKTKTLRFARCLLDLSKIQGEFDSMTLEQCECINEFVNCKNVNLTVIDSLISVEQIQSLQVRTHLHIVGSNIDYQKLHILNPLTINLTLKQSDQEINLSLLNWNFASITFRQCQIIQTSLYIKAKSIYINDCVYSTESLESLDCETLSIFACRDKQLIQLPLKSKAIQKIAELRGCILDLSGVADNWTELECYDCLLQKTNQINIQQHGSKQAKLQLKFCKLSDLNQLAGRWHSIWLDDCKLLDHQQLDQKIYSKSILLNSVNIQDFSCFQTPQFQISNCTVKQFPQYISDFVSDQDSEQKLIIKNCILFKFSVLNFPINSISFRGLKHYEYKLLYDRYTKSSHINERKKLNLDKRIKQEQKRVQIKQTFVQNISISTQNIFDHIFQLHCSSE
ncbi:Lipocalin_family conserved site [Hexamita inflata]|uniref:Lipocalin family conserved site n=1 Tax=Hexamita inflata TaxID=28002 RepID=A0AA86PSY4_9EUKA|nr:Lipocalin family conserved site [Hexamita inflata]